MSIIIFNSSTKQNGGGEEEDTSTRGGGTLEKGANTWCAVCVVWPLPLRGLHPYHLDLTLLQRGDKLNFVHIHAAVKTC